LEEEPEHCKLLLQPFPLLPVSSGPSASPHQPLLTPCATGLQPTWTMQSPDTYTHSTCSGAHGRNL
jgi:hypothetical protein